MIAAIKDIKSTLSQCSGMKADEALLETWIKNVLDAPSIKTLVKQGIASNKVKLLRDVTKAKAALNREQYFAFGEIMGEMVVIVTTP